MKAQHVFVSGCLALLLSVPAFAAAPCRIEVVEKGSGWPVPLVELRTLHQMRFVTDNAGIIAFDAPELMGVETWFDVSGHGYEIPKDGFGYRGVRLRPLPGKTLRVEVRRTMIARRLGRLTGTGLFGESQKLGKERRWRDSGILGCDSIQLAEHCGRLFWAWGDTTIPSYPLGIFHMTAATTCLRPLSSFEPPVRLKLDYFMDDKGFPRGVAPMAGDGPTWLDGFASLPDASGRFRLVATYVKIRPPMTTYESGLCVWNGDTGNFEPLRRHWSEKDGTPQPAMPHGHPVFWNDDRGKQWLLFGSPFPVLRCPASFEAWQNPASWEPLKPQESLASADDGKPVKPHGGSIAWNPWRKRWITVFMQAFGSPSMLGELWYAEADAPQGPWGPAIKVLTHENYTFYNPRLHPELTPPDSPVLLFEGTYTQLFADKPVSTARYDYNQILYRLDLDDPALAKARQTALQ